jgi:hypothetical protein
MKIAIEYERGLHDHNGYVANKALEFLAHPLNTKSFVAEGSLHQNEFNSLPHDNTKDLLEDFLVAEDISDKISRELGVYNIPISESGAGIAQLNPKVQYRVEVYEQIFGKESVNKLAKFSGIHLHIDINERRFVDQFNALSCLARVAVALLSNSPLSYNGKNGLNCHRYYAYWSENDGIFKKIPESQIYIEKIEDLISRDKKRHNNWAKEWIKKGGREEVFFGNYPVFSVHNTGYPDIRYRPDIGKGTFELRTTDSAPPDILIAYTDLVLGYVTRIITEQTKVSFGKDNKYSFSKKHIVLPDNELLQNLTNPLIVKGLREPTTTNILAQITDFSKPLMNPHHYHTISQMLNDEENIASWLMKQMPSGEKRYSSSETAQMNLKMYQRAKLGVENLKHV